MKRYSFNEAPFPHLICQNVYLREYIYKNIQVSVGIKHKILFWSKFFLNLGYFWLINARRLPWTSIYLNLLKCYFIYFQTCQQSAIDLRKNSMNIMSLQGRTMVGCFQKIFSFGGCETAGNGLSWISVMNSFHIFNPQIVSYHIKMVSLVPLPSKCKCNWMIWERNSEI